MAKSNLKLMGRLWVSLRPFHWIKNLLLFLPLVFAEKIFSFPHQISAVISFILFCMAASAVYLFNDCRDYENDRHHPVKKRRPIAKGQLSVPIALTVSLLLATLCLMGAHFLLNQAFVIILMIYIMLNLAYSAWFKSIVIIDVMVLASFYILRILGGLLALDVRISYWMIICVGLLAMFVGLNKRRQEIRIMASETQHRHVLKDYGRYFIDQMISVVTAATVISYTLYTVDKDTVQRLGNQDMIWTIPFVYYGIFRYLYLVHKRRRGGDPVRIFLSDKFMITNMLLWIVSATIAINF